MECVSCCDEFILEKEIRKKTKGCCTLCWVKSMELCYGTYDRWINFFWDWIWGEMARQNVMAGSGYWPPDQTAEEMLQNMRINLIVIMEVFNYPNICWKDTWLDASKPGDFWSASRTILWCRCCMGRRMEVISARPTTCKEKWVCQQQPSLQGPWDNVIKYYMKMRRRASAIKTRYSEDQTFVCSGIW